MNLAIGYEWHPTTLLNYLEKAICELGWTVTYVGLPHVFRPGYDMRIPITEIIDALQPKPDIFLWIDPGTRYFPVGIENLDIPTLCWIIDPHLGHWRPSAARFFDGVFVTEHDYIDHYKQAVGHDQVYWLPPCIEPTLHYDHNLPRKYDVGFIGNIVRAHRNTSRERQLKLLAAKYKTNDFFRSAKQYYSPEEIVEVYSQSRIVFNTSISGGVTQRILEGTACGALVLTDTRDEAMGNMYEFGRDVVRYTTDEDLMQKIDYYLAHEDERASIARSGSERVHSQHTYHQRVKTIVEAISAPSFGKNAPMRRARPQVRTETRIDVYTHLHMLDAILDASRAAGYNPLRRARAVLPCLARRLII